jgi:TrpR-related protein YerC/YecD
MRKIDWNRKENKQLLDAFLVLENKKDAQSFLRDLMTEKEIQEFSSRLEAARLLTKNIQYNIITKNTGLSSTTIARISKWLRGSLGGYELVLSKLHHNDTQNSTGKGLSLNS